MVALVTAKMEIVWLSVGLLLASEVPRDGTRVSCSTTISTLNLIVEMIAYVSLDLNHWGTVGTSQKLQVRQPRSPLRSWQRIAAILDAGGHHGSI